MSFSPPILRPKNSHFASGPCAKRPGWSLDVLRDACIGRSHRSKSGQAKLQEVLDRSRALLELPSDYYIGIVPGSDTGAVEMALWSLLDSRPIDMLAWENFGHSWVIDIVEHLKPSYYRIFQADYGKIPDLSLVDSDHDLVFTWNGTTSGVRVPHGNWISDTRKGLAICDATSAIFAMELPWKKLDVVTYSWQKVLGGEGAHGILILSPRAIERLETFDPERALPKLFRLTKNGKVDEGIFRGETINTPSMLCVEDALDGLKWAEQIGGLPTLIKRCEANLACLEDWCQRTPWIEFLAEDPATRSCTSICFKFGKGPELPCDPSELLSLRRKLTSILEEQGVAFDIGHYRTAPPGLRIWGGATIETSDIEALLPWLEWAFKQAIR